MQPLQIGVCTWSLAIPDLERTLAAVRSDLDLSLVHLGFMGDQEDYKNRDRVIRLVETNGLEVSATAVGFVGEDYTNDPNHRSHRWLPARTATGKTAGKKPPTSPNSPVNWASSNSVLMSASSRTTQKIPVTQS